MHGCVEDIKMHIKNLNSWLKIESKCCASFQTPEELEIIGEVTDAIKDLACAYKDCMEAKYYEEIIEAMEEGSREWEERSGYNHNHIMHEKPYVEGYLYDPDFQNEMMERGGHSSYMGYDYDHYSMAKRNYSESHNMSDKHEMDSAAKKHVEKAMGTIEEIYKSSDPAMKKELKEDLTAVVNKMPNM